MTFDPGDMRGKTCGRLSMLCVLVGVRLVGVGECELGRWLKRSPVRRYCAATHGCEAVGQNSPVVARDTNDLILCVSVYQNAKSSSSQIVQVELGPRRMHQPPLSTRCG